MKRSIVVILITAFLIGFFPAGSLTPFSAYADGSSAVQISEVMFCNDTVLLDCDGDPSDWIELYNSGDAPVDLTGWTLSNRAAGEAWSLPSGIMDPGIRVIIFASGKDYADERLHTNFTLSSKDTVYLFDDTGSIVDSLSCATSRHDVSSIHGENDTSVAAEYATPGSSNDRDGFAAFQQLLIPTGPLQISEVITANSRFLPVDGSFHDLVEVSNISGEPVLLSDYCLSDDPDEPLQWSFPAVTLAPGECVAVYCTRDSVPYDHLIHAPFSLNAESEALLLCTSDGAIIDRIYVHDIPANLSYGRLDGESGWFFFTSPTPGSANEGDHYRYISTQPEVSLAPGAYNDVEGSLYLELSAPGTIYYTLDGSLPTFNSAVYSGPIEISRTTAVRAFADEQGCIPSQVQSWTYIINANHTMPILSICTDVPADFRSAWNTSSKIPTCPGSASFYADDGGFSSACGIALRGWTSLSDPKKSLNLSFKSIYNPDDLDYDLFDTGITNYASLSVRSGQDYPLAIIRNEVCQALCKEMSDSVPTQNSKYCILYVNGSYYGIYCLKENISASNYAIINDVSKESVTILRSPVSVHSDFYINNLERFAQMDLSIPENYEEVCSVFDMDSLIDWFIMEGYCANTDVNGNLKYVRSTELDGLWRPVFYDLDWALTDYTRCFSNVIFSNLQITPFFESLRRNETFVRTVLERYAELSQTVLSDEHVLEVIDYYTAIVQPEVDHERDRWGGLYKSWERHIERVRDFILDDYSHYSIIQLCIALKVSNEVRMEYFGF